MRVFVSSPCATESRAAELIAALRAAGVDVDHSPDPSGDSSVDSRWSDWYPKPGPPGADTASGIARTLDASDVFVIVLSRGWDSSTWMGIEADEARARLEGKLLHWNPDAITVRAAGMAPYLTTALPNRLAEAVRAILQSDE